MKYNPPAGSQDPDAKYVTGQPGKVRGSAVPAEAVEHPQREIVEVIKQAGLTPDGDDLTQLWQAIGQIISTKAPIATKKKPGLVQIGNGLAITPEGLLSVLIASTSQAGLVKPRYGLKIGKDGSLDVDFGDMPTDKFEELLKSIRVPIWLTANKTFYVNSATGSDTLDAGRGESAGKPFKTCRAAAQYVAENYNMSSYRATILLAEGEYNEGDWVLPKFSATTGNISIEGKSKEAKKTTIVRGRVLLELDSVYLIRHLTIDEADSETYGYAVCAQAGRIDLYDVDIDVRDTVVQGGTLYPIRADGGKIRVWASNEAALAGIEIIATNKVTGFFQATNGGTLAFSADISVRGDATVDSFAYASLAGSISRSSSTLSYPGRLPNIEASGVITGKKYTVMSNGIIDTLRAGQDFFPGTIAGSTESGGQYV